MRALKLEEFQFDGQLVVRNVAVRRRVWRSSLENIADSHLSAAAAWWQSFLRGGAVHPDKVLTSPPFRSVDAFCGCGGLTLGAAQASIAVGRNLESVAAIDVDEGALAVHKNNFDTKHLLQGNAASLVDFHISESAEHSRFAYEPEILDPRLADEVGKIDLFLAGPPCQGHSNLNNRTRREDPRNLLYLTAVALAVGLRSKALVLENVPEVVNDRSGVVVVAKALLRAAGFGYIDSCVLGAAELGGAQTRKRYFLIASRNKQKDGALNLKSVMQGLKYPARPLSWAVGDLLDDPSKSQHGIMDTVPALSEENLARINHLFDNELYELPDAVRPDCHKNGNTYPSVYGRLHWDRPAQTITTGFLSPGRGRYIHPISRRVITPHEAARLQSFPDTFRFVVDDGNPPSRSSLSKWIGDAVPPLLGYAATLPLLALP